MGQRDNSFRANFRLGHKVGKEKIWLARDVNYLKDPSRLDSFCGLAGLLDFFSIPTSKEDRAEKRAIAQSLGFLYAYATTYCLRRDLMGLDRYLTDKMDAILKVQSQGQTILYPAEQKV